MPSFTAEVSTTVEVEFEVYCERCGAGLCNQSVGRQSYRRNSPQVSVEPCNKCLDDHADAEIEKAIQSARAEWEKEHE